MTLRCLPTQAMILIPEGCILLLETKRKKEENANAENVILTQALHTNPTFFTFQCNTDL